MGQSRFKKLGNLFYLLDIGGAGNLAEIGMRNRERTSARLERIDEALADRFVVRKLPDRPMI